MSLKFSTGALARACARRPWTTIGIWVLIFLVAGFLTVSFLGDALTTQFTIFSHPESKRADDLLEARLRGPETGRSGVRLPTR